MDIRAATEEFLARGGVITRLPDEPSGRWARLEMQGVEGFLAALGVLSEPERVKMPPHHVGGFRPDLDATKEAVFASLSRHGKADTRELSDRVGVPISLLRYALTTLRKEGRAVRQLHGTYWEINPAWRGSKSP